MPDDFRIGIVIVGRGRSVGYSERRIVLNESVRVAVIERMPLFLFGHPGWKFTFVVQWR